MSRDFMGGVIILVGIFVGYSYDHGGMIEWFIGAIVGVLATIVLLD